MIKLRIATLNGELQSDAATATCVIFQEHIRSPIVVVPYPTLEPGTYQLQIRLVCRCPEATGRNPTVQSPPHLDAGVGFFVQCSACIPLKWYSHSVNRNVV